MSVRGQQMSTHEPAPPDAETRKLQQVRPDEWPVTVAMLQRTLQRINDRQQTAACAAGNDATQQS